MSLTRVHEALTRALELVAILAVLTLVVGQVVGGPLLLGFVRTGSMQPTLDPGDGFVAVPASLSGPIEQGDVVVYRAEEIQGGGLTTHRVVGRTNRGYITRGDNNAVTDQDSGEPPVKEEQIVSTVLQVNGRVLVVPDLGDAMTLVRDAVSDGQRQLAILLGTGLLLGASGSLYLFAGVVFALYAIDVLRGRNSRTRERSRTRTSGTDARLVVGAFTLLLLLGLTLPMVVPSGTQRVDLVSASFDSERATVVRAGESKSHQRELSNGGLVPVRVYVESKTNGVDVHPRVVELGARSRANVTVTLHAPESTGHYRHFVSHHHYLAILPESVLDALYRTHPWLPIAVIDAVIGIPFYVVGRRLLGRGRLRHRSRGRTPSATRRIRRLLK